MTGCRWSECYKVFTSHSNRVRHEKKCKKGEFVITAKKLYTCPNSRCQQKVFNRKSNFDKHFLSCKQKVVKVFLCPYECDFTSNKQSRLNRHLSQKHSTKTQYSCMECEKVYIRRDKYDDHMLKYHQVTPNDVETEQVAPDFDVDFELLEPWYADDVVEPYADDIAELTNTDVAAEPSFNFTSVSMRVADPDGDDSTVATDQENHRFYVLHNDPELAEQLDSTHISEYSPLEYDIELASCTLKHLKLLKHQSKRSSMKLQEFARLCLLLFNNKQNDYNFMTNLADDLGFKDVEELIGFINAPPTSLKRGRPLSGLVERQLMYDFWVDNSEVSNDRRNARHVVKVKPAKLNIAVADLSDNNIETFKSKGGTKMKAQRHIYSLTVQELYANFCKAHHELKCSSSLFWRCKPFYIGPATDRECEGCLCAKCLNPHSLYNTIRRYVKDLPLSLTDYLTTLFLCGKDRDLNFPKMACIAGTCENHCSIFDESNKSTYPWDKRVSYYQFEKKTETYYNKKGELKEYQRTARVDYHDAILKDAYLLLLSSAENYLMHRYHTIIDKVYWGRYVQETMIPVVWMDYSVNIKLVEKNQVQSAHFSGKQQTLHDSLIQYPGKRYKYVYHLSNDTNHDSVMTNRVVQDIVANHPEVIESGRLILRSDNCSTQYKSRFVFKALLQIAEKLSIRIDFFYGEAGHGRGLIDAMAWFGCKGPIRKSIITDDEWYTTAEEMVEFLKGHFGKTGDQTKEYYLVEQKDTANDRVEGREERRIPGCNAAHVISFFPDGHSISKWLTLKDFMEAGNADEGDQFDEEDENDDDEQSGENETEEMTWVESVDHTDMFQLIEKDSFIAIKSHKSSREQFHLFKVEDKKVATDHIQDTSGEHNILCGEPYLVCRWYSYQNESRKFAQYANASDTAPAFIHVGEVISTNLEIDNKDRMDINTFRMLMCSL